MSKFLEKLDEYKETLDEYKEILDELHPIQVQCHLTSTPKTWVSSNETSSLSNAT